MAGPTPSEMIQFDKIMPCVETGLVYANYRQFSRGFPVGPVKPIGFFGRVLHMYSELDAQLLGFQIESAGGQSAFVDEEDYAIPHHARFKFHESSGLYILDEKEWGEIGVEPIFNIFEIKKFATEQHGERFTDLLEELARRI